MLHPSKLDLNSVLTTDDTDFKSGFNIRVIRGLVLPGLEFELRSELHHAWTTDRAGDAAEVRAA